MWERDRVCLCGGEAVILWRLCDCRESQRQISTESLYLYSVYGKALTWMCLGGKENFQRFVPYPLWLVSWNLWPPQHRLWSHLRPRGKINKSATEILLKFKHLCYSGLREQKQQSITNKARLHGSVIVIGEGVEDTVSLDFIGLMYDPLHHTHYFMVAQFISCITYKGKIPWNVFKLILYLSI